MALFEADYVAVHGDGVLAVFTGNGACVKAFLASVSFLTACEEYIEPNIKNKTSGRVCVKCRCGVSYGSTIVKRIGRRGSWNNEVWAYRTANETAKLCSLAEPGKLVVNEKAFNRLQGCTEVSLSCGCHVNREHRRKIERKGEKKQLWKELDYEILKNTNIDKAWELQSIWYPEHGAEYFQKIAVYFDISFSKIVRLETQL